MKKLFLLLMITLCVLVSCESMEMRVIQLSFENQTYSLSAEVPLEIVLQSSQDMRGLTAVPFTISGSAIEDEDFTISDHEFVFLPATTKARIMITPKNNYVKGRDIVLTLNSAPDGVELSGYTSASVSVEARKSIKYSFSRDTTNLYASRIVRVKIEEEDGTPWISQNDVKLPINLSGTAQNGVHYSIEGNQKEFVVPAGSDEATITLNWLKSEPEKDEIIITIPTNQGVHHGVNGEIVVQITEPSILSDLIGVWEYNNEFISEDYLMWWVTYAEGLDNLPTSDSSSGTIEFVSGDCDSFAVNLSGDLSNYFRATESVTFTESIMEDFAEQDWDSGMVFYIVLGNINVNFSANNVKERSAMVGFRFLNDEKTKLEVRIVDYEPTDFLVGDYEESLDWGFDYPMKDFYPLVFNFVRK